MKPRIVFTPPLSWPRASILLFAVLIVRLQWTMKQKKRKPEFVWWLCMFWNAFPLLWKFCHRFYVLSRPVTFYWFIKFSFSAHFLLLNSRSNVMLVSSPVFFFVRHKIFSILEMWIFEVWSSKWKLISFLYSILFNLFHLQIADVGSTEL